jgi:hypothetical protein
MTANWKKSADVFVGLISAKDKTYSIAGKESPTTGRGILVANEMLITKDV